MKTIIEPFRFKLVEPIRLTTTEEREAALRAAYFNLFQIPAEQVIIDLLTDSGTSAMSHEQWAGMLRGDESYAGARSWYHFERVVRDLTGMQVATATELGRRGRAHGLHVLAAEIGRRMALVTMLGPRLTMPSVNGVSLGVLANAVLFVRLCGGHAVGVEADWARGVRDAELTLLSQAHVRLGRHGRLQVGVGAHHQEARGRSRWDVVAGVRLILER